MKSAVAGLAIVFASMGFFAMAAGAAEIPPTPKCNKLMKQLLRESDEFEAKNPTPAERRKDERRLINSFAEAGCISDPEPILKELKAKPFTEKCAVAAKSADKFWTPANRRIRALLARKSRTIKPLLAQERRIIKKIQRLQLRGAPKKRIRQLRRAHRDLLSKLVRIERKSFKQLRVIARPSATPSTGILLELLSLRCFDLQSDTWFPGEEGARGPAARVVQKNWPLLIFGFSALEDDRPTSTSLSSLLLSSSSDHSAP